MRSAFLIWTPDFARRLNGIIGVERSSGVQAAAGNGGRDPRRDGWGRNLTQRQRPKSHVVS